LNGRFVSTDFFLPTIISKTYISLFIADFAAPKRNRALSLLQKRPARFYRPSQLPIELVSDAQWSDGSSRLEENGRMILSQNNAGVIAFKKENFQTIKFKLSFLYKCN
jgi:hypothetical protein